MTSAPVLYLAPLRGLTDAIFRETFSGHFTGIDLAVAPFVSTVRGHRIKATHLRDLLPEKNRSMTVVPQIIGKSAQRFIVLARALMDLGYGTINWNLGCPYPMVARKQRGSGLLPFADRIDAFLEKVMATEGLTLSIKTRLGRHHHDEIRNLMPVFNRFPIKELIIHPRTGVQMYDGRPDLRAYQHCFEQSRHPVVYNGDICSAADFHWLQHRLDGTAGWMIGRGLICNPFLAEEIKTGSNHHRDKVSVFRHFHDDLFDRYRQVLSGPAHLLNRMKGMWKYFAGSFEGDRHILKKIQKCRHIDAYLGTLERFFTAEAIWQPAQKNAFVTDADGALLERMRNG